MDDNIIAICYFWGTHILVLLDEKMCCTCRVVPSQCSTGNAMQTIVTLD